MPNVTWPTPPTIASQLGIHPDKVVKWITSGELRAFNVATSQKSKKPRWRIDPADLATFLASRQALPRQAASPRQRSKQRSGYKEFF